MSDKTLIIVRPRPLFPSEVKKECKNVLQYPPYHLEGEQALIAGNKIFSYNHVLNHDSNQQEVFSLLKPVIQRVFEGYNATILAYGQTGAGKTYTMGTGKKEEMNDESQGVVPRMIKATFEETRDTTQVCVSFMEVYNEEVYDLLASKPSKLEVKGFKVVNLTEKAVNSVEEALLRLDEGIEGRKMCATQANASSSRSHAIFTLHLHQTTETGILTSKLHLVDLAGSESLKKTCTQTMEFHEGVSINKSLLTLGKVVYALSENLSHVSFRDSKLTAVLKDSLSGNCVVSLITCISPSDKDFVETINSLRFGQRAKKIKNPAKLNKILEDHRENIDLLELPSSTPFKMPSAAARKIKGTPGTLTRKPLKTINLSMPSPFIPRVPDKLMLSTISESASQQDREREAEISHFEPARCSSSLSFYNYNHDQNDLSVMMNTIISDKFSELLQQTEQKVLEQTEQIIERKLEDTLRKMRSIVIAPLTSQLSKVAPMVAPSAMQTSSIGSQSQQQSPLAKIRLFQESPEILSSTPELRRRSPRFQAGNIEEIYSNSPSAKVQKGEVTIGPDSPQLVTYRKSTSILETDNILYSQASPVVKPTKRRSMRIMEMVREPENLEPPIIPKRRKSMRIEEIRQSLIDLPVPSKLEGNTRKRKSTRLSLKSYRPLDSSLSSSRLELSPNMAEYFKDMSFRGSTQRNSVISFDGSDTSLICTSMASQKSISNPSRSHGSRPARKSLSIPQGRRSSLAVETQNKSRRKSHYVILSDEDTFEEDTTTQATKQEMHNRKVLKNLNSFNLRDMQKYMPTIGPKTAYIICNYRKLNGNFDSLEALQNVPGLAKSYYSRFLKANNVIV